MGKHIHLPVDTFVSMALFSLRHGPDAYKPEPLAQSFLQGLEEARFSMCWADLLILLPAAWYQLAAFLFAALFHYLCALGHLSLISRYVVSIPGAICVHGYFLGLSWLSAVPSLCSRASSGWLKLQ